MPRREERTACEDDGGGHHAVEIYVDVGTEGGQEVCAPRRAFLAPKFTQLADTD